MMEKRGVCPGENEESKEEALVKKAATPVDPRKSCGDDLLSRMADGGKEQMRKDSQER